MANCCVIDLCIEYKDEKDAKAFIDYIKQEKAQAKKENYNSIYMGCNRYFFNVCPTQYESQVTVSGWVKWALDDADIVAWVNHIKSIAPFETLKAYYEELGCSLYGYYEVGNNGQLSCAYVPESRFPHYNDEEDNDNFWEDLETLLQTNPETYIIKENINE